MKLIRIASRILVGIIFVFSGFVKAVDPLGSTYKFSDYFEAFHIEFLNFLTFPLAIILCVIELCIGLNLLLGIRIKITSWFLLAFMSFFTILTFILAIFNPVTDCGCFGDALILTNWQTFWKNIIIFIPSLVIFIQRNKYVPFYKNSTEWGLTSAFILFGLILTLYNYYNLPVLNFRPYKIGTDIPESMIIPEGSPADEYEITLIYEKEGKQKEFTVENIPDSTWSWIETKQKLIKKGYEPPIHDFSISTLEGEDITDIVLADDGYTFLVISNNLNKSNQKSFQKINKLSAICKEKDCRFICLTASTKQAIKNFVNTVNPTFEICTADDITLKTIIRSNPGLILIKQGVIIGKWHYQDIPQKIDNNILSFSIDTIRKEKNRLLIFSFMVGFFLVISVFHIVLLKICNKKKYPSD